MLYLYFSIIKFIQTGDIRYYQTDENYDVVLLLFQIIGYQNSNQNLLNSFQTMADALEEGGTCIFDAWYEPGVLIDIPEVRITRVNGKDMNSTRIAETIIHPMENVVDVSNEMQVRNTTNEKVEIIKALHSMRYFFYPRSRILLVAMQIKPIKVY